MDFGKLVQKKLQENDKCLCSLLGNIVDGPQRSICIVSVIEHSEEHGVFVHSLKDALTENPKDLRLTAAIPVDSSFKFNIVSSSAGTKGVILVKLDNLDQSLLVELPQGDKLTTLLAEFKRTLQVHTQNAGFGLPSTFTWMEKYLKRDSSLHGLAIFDGPEAAGNDWPFNEIIQITGGKCPVVKDDTMCKAVSTDSLGIQESISAPNTGQQSVVRRSPCAAITEPRSVGVGSREVLAGLLMKEREAEYTRLTDYRVFCGTWNVNGQIPSEKLHKWLSPEEDDPPDIYAIGFQELDLSKNVYIFSESAREDEWLHKVEDALHVKAKYKKVKLIRLVAMMLVVFVKDELYYCIKELLYESIGTGLLGVMGNKGGVAIRFRLHDTTICFVNSHLAAHTEEYERRNQDFRDISSRLNFRSGETQYSISEHDIVFWLGDLNYRICDIESDDCKRMIQFGQLEELMNYDQLCRQITLKRVFLDYFEGRINFIPTYKYDTGSDNWDSSDKCRTPAWCDRVLWRGENVSQLAYRSHPQLKLSDHKPVSAVFKVGIKTYDLTLERKVREEVMKLLDQKENEFLPQVSLDVTDVHFENLYFMENQSRTVTITNTGQVPVSFEFINKPSDSHYCQPWLKIEPSRGFIHIGESCLIQLDLCIDKATAPAMNLGIKKIEDILVLHLKGGKDFFITVSGSYVLSCFGSSIEVLVRMFSPIREVDTAELIQIEKATYGSSSENKERPLDVPKELWRLIDHLFTNGLDQDELFQTAGLGCEFNEIRDCLDTGSPMNLPGSIHSVAEALLIFLSSLAEPVIPGAFFDTCIKFNGNLSQCKQVLNQLPVSHRNVFKYICAFLRVLLLHSTKNKLDLKLLARIFGRILLRCQEESAADFRDSVSIAKRREDELKCESFLQTFLINEYDE